MARFEDKLAARFGVQRELKRDRIQKGVLASLVVIAALQAGLVVGVATGAC